MNSGQPCYYKGYLLMKYLESQDYILITPNGNVTSFDRSLTGYKDLRDSLRSGDYVFSVMSSSWYKAAVGNILSSIVPIEIGQLPSEIKTICLLNDITF